MTDPVQMLQTVPVAVAVSILLAGIMWYASAVHVPGLVSSNLYFSPSTVDCDTTWLANSQGYMSEWIHTD